MKLFEITSLEESYKVYSYFLAVFSFSTSSKTSLMFMFNRCLIFIVLTVGVGQEVILQLHHHENNANSSLNKVFQALHFILLFGFCVTLLFSTAFHGYQMFIKKKTLKVFSSLHKMDSAMAKFCNTKFNYRKTFRLNCITNIFLFIMCIVSTFSAAVESNSEVFQSFMASFLTFYGFLLFFIVALVTSLSNEVRLRLKNLNSHIAREKLSVLCKHRPADQIDSDSVLLIVDLASVAISNITEFFAVELLIILGK